MRIVVTGVWGQIASSLRERGPAAGHEVIALGRPVLDLSNPETAIPAILAAASDIVVSAAAYTAVDQAESEPGLAMAINGSGAGKVAEAAAQAGVPLIHISTDYVFDGKKLTPYLESDSTAPLCVYGATKLAGERAVAAASDDHAILRVAWVYSPFGGNFVKTMLRLAETRKDVRVVADQHGGPTSALDIADAILQVAERMMTDRSRELRGIFHMPPSGEASWADFAEEIFRDAGTRGCHPCRVERIAAADYAAPARRPMNSRLNGDKLRHVYGISLPHWAQSLDDCMGRLEASVAAQRALET
jgi:dTDP-4-dehydrorhamnose reductase